MAGTNRKARGAPVDASRGPAIILVEPQLGQNIGMVARAMLNCGLLDLRLVAPRDGWPSRGAESAASGALAVIENARLFDTIEAAIGDLRRLYVSTARQREQVKIVVTPRQMAAEIRALEAAGDKRSGILFGPERMGLSNDAIALGDALVQVPLNPAFSSLNLAQAVLLLAYEWHQSGDSTPPRRLETGHEELAKKAHLTAFLERLEGILQQRGFFHPPEKTPSMQRGLRSIFTRAGLTERDLRALHGVVSALLGAKLRRAPQSDEESDRSGSDDRFSC